ncbi:MAG: hypothetical protein VKJ02_18650 [Snowella sp.]|nr:hypothetical protein [Snowella sp.]
MASIKFAQSAILALMAGASAFFGGNLQPVHAQATATGSLSFYQPSTNTLYTIGGEISTPTGLSFSGPTTITPGAIDSFPDPTNPDPALAAVAVPNSLTIDPGFVQLDPLLPLNAQIAALLSGLILPIDLSQIVSIIRASSNVVDTYSPARAAGSVTYSNGEYLQTISGEMSLAAGYFPGPLYIEPSFGNIATGDPNSGAYPRNLGLISSFIISGGIPLFDNPPATINAAAALKLSEATTLSEQVSILRAGSDLLNSSSVNQSTITANTTLTYVGNDPNLVGFSQSVSGEVALPKGLYYFGPVAESRVPGTCDVGSSCLFIASIVDNNLDVGVPRLDQLIVDPGVSSLLPIPYDLNAQAAITLLSLTNLSDIVSFIRAGSTANGPSGTTLQARASGSAIITTPNGSTQSVSGEISLPSGLYFERPAADANCRNGGGGCLAVTPDVQLEINVGGITSTTDLAYIAGLTLDPGPVEPGDALAPTGLQPLNFNAQVANQLYQAATSGSVSDVVSIIRAGTGSNGLSASSEPVAKASGGVTISLPNGAVQSVTGELSLPAGQYFDGSAGCVSGGGCLTITPTLTNRYDGTNLNLVAIQSLVVDPGLANATNRLWNFDAAAAYALTQQTTLPDQISVIRAGAGSNGLD